MESTYNFLRQTAGLCAFARVTVEVLPAEVTPGAELRLEERIAAPDRNEGEVNSVTEPEWVAAALEGAAEVQKYAAEKRGLATDIFLTRVVGTHVDTNPDAVYRAAALAVWTALLPEEPLPEFSFDGSRFVKFPS